MHYPGDEHLQPHHVADAELQGWTPKAIGALAGCIITAIVGFLTVVWYGHGALDESEIEEEVRRKMAQKQQRKGMFKKLVGRGE